jgi:hypothetical protein
MNQQEVLKVLESLAYGNDPASGRGATMDTLRSADTIRALFAAIALIDGCGAGAGRRVGRNSAILTSAGTLWSRHEDARLCQEHEQGMTTAQIALQHGRSSKAITTRLIKLGRIEPSTVAPNKLAAKIA